MSEVQWIGKSWGGEKVAINTSYCGKILYLVKGKYSSVHFHKEKDECFWINRGAVQVDLIDHDNSWWQKIYDPERDPTDYASMWKNPLNWSPGRIRQITMNKGDVLHLPPLTVHRFKGLRDSEIIEFSTHSEDSDSFRIIPSCS